MPEKNSIHTNSIVSKSKEHLSSSIDSETVLLSISKNNYYGMGPIASHIWKLLEHPIHVHDLIHILLQEYEVEHYECTSDVISFLQDLKNEDLINIHDQ